MITLTEAQEMHECIGASLQAVRDGNPCEAAVLEPALEIATHLVADLDVHDDDCPYLFEITEAGSTSEPAWRVSSRLKDGPGSWGMGIDFASQRDAEAAVSALKVILANGVAVA